MRDFHPQALCRIAPVIDTDISSAREASTAIAGWSRTNKDEACQSIIQLLSRLEGRALAPRALLEIAEVLRPPGDELIVGYRSGYTDRALPLGEEEAARFGRAMALLHAFERLYQRAAETALAAPPGDPFRKDAAGALQRSMACIVNQMIEHYRARQSVGLALWKGLQQRMQTAVREKLDAVQVPDLLYPRGMATAHETYGRALLLSIAQAGAMTHRSLEATLLLTALFADLVELAMLDSSEVEGRARPPGGVAGVGIQRTGRIRVVAVGGVTHLVNTTKIDGALNWCVQQLRGGGTPEQIGLATVAQADLAALLPRLRRIWCGGGEIRETPRQSLHGQSAIAIGFREISEFASREPLTMPREFGMYTGEPALFVRTTLAWSSDQPSNPVESWQTVDHSASGMRARRPQPGAQLRRGQLLAVDLKGVQNGSGFALAEVRWLQQFTDSDGGGIAAGVRFVSSEAQVAVVRARDVVPGQYQTVGPAFLLDQASQQLVVPAGWFAPARKVDLWYKERLSLLRLTDLQTRGADYEIVGYEVIKPQETAAKNDAE